MSQWVLLLHMTSKPFGDAHLGSQQVLLGQHWWLWECVLQILIDHLRLIQHHLHSDTNIALGYNHAHNFRQLDSRGNAIDVWQLQLHIHMSPPLCLSELPAPASLDCREVSRVFVGIEEALWWLC